MLFGRSLKRAVHCSKYPSPLVLSKDAAGGNMDRSIHAKILCRAKFIGLVGLVLMRFHVSAADNASCVPSDTDPVKICFDDPPITIDHCSKEIVPHFRVKRKRRAADDEAFYYFTYELSVDRKDYAVVDPFKELQQKYGLRLDDPTTEMRRLSLHWPNFIRDGDYKIKLTAYVDGRQTPFSEVSSSTHLHDRPIVKSLVVGISNYDDPEATRLLHADSDARTFAVLLHSLFPDSPDPIVLTSDAKDGNGTSRYLPTKENINAQLQAMEEADRDLCTGADWFVFYFSGHGIVGVDSANNEIEHFVSTKSFQPSALRTTAIRIPDLLNAIANIRAKNKLLILDSCFSGWSTIASSKGDGRNTSAPSPDATKTMGRHRSTKVEFVRDGKLVDAIQPGDPDPYNLGGDTLAFGQTAAREDKDQRHVLYLAAANATHEAEEGYVIYEEGKLHFTPSDDENEEQHALGHGLYTYVWTWNLLKQVSRLVKLPNFPGALPNPRNDQTCSVNFGDAATAADTQITDDLRHNPQNRDYQRPEVAGKSQHSPDSVSCDAAQR